MQQARISSFFQGSPKAKKRPAPSSEPEVIDLSDSEDEDRAPPTKKQRAEANLFLPGTPSPPPEPAPVKDKGRGSGAAEQWRYNPQSPGPSPKRSDEDEAFKRRRKDEFKKKLLQENSRFVNMHKAEVVDDLEGADVDRNEQEERSQSEDDLGDGKFEALQDLFGHKSGAKGKGKAKSAKAGKRNKKPEEIGPSGKTYTALEQQVRILKAKYPGVLLIIEVGYKCRFFGEDAKIAAKELGIVCYMDRNFPTASIPTHRRDIHLKKLLSKGHKVGIVEQTETAALKKVGDNRNAPFERDLTHLYTAVTYVDSLDSADDLDHSPPPLLMCIVESLLGGMGVDEKVAIGMIILCPSTGDVVWDQFEDGHMRTELETRMIHTKPAELLLPEKKLSKPTERMLAHFASSASFEHGIRMERYKKRMSYTDAFEFVSDFYTKKTKNAKASESFTSGKLMAAVTDLPQQVVIALAQCIQHLAAFNIADALLVTQFFSKFTTRAHMILNGNTLTNLSLLKGLPDLAKGLCRIQYGKCTTKELSILLPAFNKAATTFSAVPSPSDVGFKSPLLNEIIFAWPQLREPVQELIGAISLKNASEGNMELLWTDPEKYPEVSNADMGIQAVEIDLDDELKSIRRALRKPSLQYSIVAGEEFLVEIPRTDDRIVPPDWQVISSTKKVRRYRSPAIRAKVEERARFKEQLDAAARAAFLSFLEEITQNHYALLRDAVNKLAIADCLCSLAHVATNQGYVKPTFTPPDAEDELHIVEGRHPMVEALMSAPFVANDVCMGAGSPRSKIITGPNMGGKSSAVRMVALIAIMAQVGSYVPAKEVRMSLLDGVLTRMGASDELARGRSTFMVEMSETSDILLSSTSKSLVILDELGRGTSTFDGMAIAQAVLQHLVEEKKCKTLFITHYPLVAIDLERRFPQDLQNLHMGFREDTRITGVREITFLYRLTPGLAKGSFGVECARLAGLPEEILTAAGLQAEKLRVLVEERNKRNK
ncbi:hypothetical protein EWM64_g6915 [Hericium alpestre]|uniref:DNA mismatch repair protein MSH3 n=1 Tax=Hericium alpestre TaxID=135208 RepID=A0A4Y9ZUC7_9AGAM|nr:hypothetical protein EWM64_g6915 [Hericium alpestre]